MTESNQENLESIFNEIKDGSHFFIEDLFYYNFIKTNYERNKVSKYCTYAIFYTNQKVKRDALIRYNVYDDGNTFIDFQILNFNDANGRYNYLRISDYLKSELKIEGGFRIRS